MPLKGMNVVVTGGSGGIGIPLCQSLIHRGAEITVIGRQDVPDLPLELLRGDLSSAEGIQAVAETLKQRKVDILINLAGIQYFGPFEQQSTEHIIRNYTVNLLAPILLTQAVLPSMRKQRSGHIVNIGSTFGSIAFAHFATYSSAKAGLRSFSEALRRELADTPIHVTHISPRAVRTSMNNDNVMRLAELTNMTMDSPEHVANRIIQAIIAKEPEVYIGFPEKLFVRINSLLPRLIDKALQKNDRLAARLFNTF